MIMTSCLDTGENLLDDASVATEHVALFPTTQPSLSSSLTRSRMFRVLYGSQRLIPAFTRRHYWRLWHNLNPVNTVTPCTFTVHLIIQYRRAQHLNCMFTAFSAFKKQTLREPCLGQLSRPPDNSVPFKVSLRGHEFSSMTSKERMSFRPRSESLISFLFYDHCWYDKNGSYLNWGLAIIGK